MHAETVSIFGAYQFRNMLMEYINLGTDIVVIFADYYSLFLREMRRKT